MEVSNRSCTDGSSGLVEYIVGSYCLCFQMFGFCAGANYYVNKGILELSVVNMCRTALMAITRVNQRLESTSPCSFSTAAPQLISDVLLVVDRPFTGGAVCCVLSVIKINCKHIQWVCGGALRVLRIVCGMWRDF